MAGGSRRHSGGWVVFLIVRIYVIAERVRLRVREVGLFFVFDAGRRLVVIGGFESGFDGRMAGAVVGRGGRLLGEGMCGG